MYKTILLALAAFCLCGEAIIFSRCGLVQELKRQGFPSDKLRDWVCLIEAESGRNTAAVSPVNQNGSRDWGLFQINDKYWCSASQKAGKDCHVRCADVITDNITEASKCAKLIYERLHFDAWYGWINKCKDKPLPDISNC